MCEEWIRKNKVLIGIVLLVIVFIFLFKKSENFDEKDLKFDASKLRKKEIENSRFTNIKITDAFIENVLINNAKLNNAKLQMSTLEDAELNGNTMMKDVRVDGNLRMGDNILIGQNALALTMPESSSINLSNEDSRISIGGYTLTANDIKFLKDLQTKESETKSSA